MFRFKQFAIDDSKTPMKVGTDGVLLGAWVSIWGSEQRVLDVGTGSGVIALMIAQRAKKLDVVIDAVEIDEMSAEQARENVSNSPWPTQVRVYNADIKMYAPTQRYDLIVSNPPYFINSLQCPDITRTTARHTTDLNFEELIEAVTKLLTESGRFALILPTLETQTFDTAASDHLTLTRRCLVYSREGSGEAKRVLSEFKLKSDSTRSVTEERLTIETTRSREYTEEYRALTRDFYLKF